MKKKSLLVLFLVGLSIFISGCIDDEFTAEQIAEKLQDKQANIEDYSATAHITVSADYQVQEIEYEIVQKMPDKSRSVVVEPNEQAGIITVCNGESVWVYDPAIDAVIIDSLVSSDTSAIDYTGIPAIDYTSLISGMLNESHVSMEGLERIDDKDTYIISIEPKDNSSDEGDVTDGKVWIDKETWMPLKIEMSRDDEEQVLVEYQNFKFNSGISDEEFEFEIPEGANVFDLRRRPVKMTFEEAQGISEFEMNIPSYIPEGYEPDNVQFSNNSLATGLKESFTLIYSGAEDNIAISEHFYEGERDSSSFPIWEAETVFVNGAEANLYTMDGDNKWLEWETGYVTIHIRGSLDTEEIIKIAESMDVPTSIIENEL